MYLFAPFTLQNFKKILRPDPELWGCAIFWPKMVHLSWTKNFLVQTIIITFIYLLALFIVQNILKILTANPEFWGWVIFGPKMVHLPQTKTFFWKIVTIIFIYVLPPFILQNFKKILRPSPELWGCAIFVPKIPQFLLYEFFWNKPLLLLSSTYWSFRLPSLGKILKKLQMIQSYEEAPFLGPKWFICLNFFFEKLLISLSSTY